MAEALKGDYLSSQILATPRTEQITPASHADSVERSYKLFNKGDFEPNSMRAQRISETLELKNPELGIFGTFVKNKELSVVQVLTTYKDETFRANVNNRNQNGGDMENYFSALGAQHDLDTEEVFACVDYYLRHEEVFDAYFLVENAKKTQDPLVSGHLLPKQLTFGKIEA